MNRIRFYLAEVVVCGLPFLCALLGHASGHFCIWTQTGRLSLWAHRELERQRHDANAHWLASLPPDERAEWEEAQRAPLPVSMAIRPTAFQNITFASGVTGTWTYTHTA